MLADLMKIRYNSFDMSKPGYLSNNSSSGFPFFEYSLEYKKQHLKYIISHLDEIIKLCENTDLEGLSKHGIIMANNVQIRRQSDKWVDGAPKKRIRLDFLEAHSNGVGRPFSRDEYLSSIDNRLANCRTRVVRAFSGPLNYMFTGAVAPYRNFADSRYAFTFKHKDKSDILSKLAKYKVFKGVDVTQFDNSVSGDILNRWLENFPFSDVGRKIANLMFHAPTVDSTTGLANGNPLDETTFIYNSGLPSGIFSTSMMGKDIMSSTILTAYQRAIGRQLTHDDIKHVLVGENDEFGFLNMGDDSIIMGNEESLVAAVMEELQRVFFDIEEERGIVFLGNILYQSPNGLNLANNMASYFDKIYVPERSIKSKLRPYPMLGAIQRREIYSSHPLFNEMRSIEKDMFYNFFGRDIDMLENDNLTKPKLNMDVLTDADIDVLVNYERLFYKYDRSDINPAIADTYVSVISHDDSAKLMQYLVKDTK
jgi:hypothetical protein